MKKTKHRNSLYPLPRSGVIALALATVCIIACKEPPRAPAQAPIVPFVSPRIVAALPHDSLAFTQGLFYASGRLYESTGLYGRSSIRVLDAATGRILKNTPVTSGVFAEGCARLGGEIVQITWKEQTAFVYSFPEMAPQRTLPYAGEGWGLTADTAVFYMSNGSDTLFVRDASFGVVRTIPVRFRGQPLPSLNELEYVNGRIYANVWYSNYIFEIDPASGAVTRVIDCADLVQRERPSTTDNVLNGIAYNPQSGKFYLTGKNWKNIFVVEIPNP
jgi:glutamine cyclotransferase